MKKLNTLIALLLCIAVTQAQRSKKVKGNGNEVTIERNTQDYDGLRVGGSFEVELIQGQEGHITLSGEDNILEYITTEVQDEVLIIKKIDNVDLRPSRGKRVLITIPIESIDAIRLSGAGRLYSHTTLKGDDFKIRTSGSRNLKLSIEARSVIAVSSGSSTIQLDGNTEALEVTSSGSSNVRAYEMLANVVELKASGSSNIRATANESLTSKISGSANIRYRGNPDKISNKVSGSGSVSKK
ncbi:head GIN domain-containing protein [Ulvibacterium sp.]|uniref:head GIN domain-containing protein n=1 Tax=Ulvibacterium sp. TaxID=2665914 RepID=UPI003BAD56D5